MIQFDMNLFARRPRRVLPKIYHFPGINRTQVSQHFTALIVYHYTWLSPTKETVSTLTSTSLYQQENLDFIYFKQRAAPLLQWWSWWFDTNSSKRLLPYTLIQYSRQRWIQLPPSPQKSHRSNPQCWQTCGCLRWCRGKWLHQLVRDYCTHYCWKWNTISYSSLSSP